MAFGEKSGGSKGSFIATCSNANCISEYQDMKYGKNRRVHARNSKGTQGSSGGGCTVCSAVRFE